MYIAPGQGLTTPWGQKFDVNRNLLSLQSYVASFKKSPWSLILYSKFSLAGADSPQGTKFWCQQICLVTSFICYMFKKNVFEVWFYTFFSWLNTCSPRAGAKSSQGTKFWCQQKGLITFPICCKFQRNFFEVWFYKLFSWLIHVYSSGAGDKILMSTERPYHFTHLLQVSKKSLWSLILYNFVHDLIH